jgi:hypothetical protein
MPTVLKLEFMKFFCFLILILLTGNTCLFAQNQHSITGKVIDSTSVSALVNTSIVVLDESDSVVVAHTRTNSSGAFNINLDQNGRFILLLTYPGYADYVEHFSLDISNSGKNFGNINLLLKSTLLADVIIHGKSAAIKFHGDTTEFNASSFNITPNSKVEDLLKQLPGIQIGKDGSITAQGKTVNKILVDGEEFFGDDPTLVTRNIRADMVDKIQVYEKRSDQATFIGSNDGDKTKTINLKLRENKKNGYFGKLEVGIGNNGFSQSQIMAAAFKGNERIAGFGIFSKTGQVGLAFGEAGKYSGNSGVEIMADGGIVRSSVSDEFSSWDGKYNGQGIPNVKNSGIHYENKWGGDKYVVNGNYKVGQIQLNGIKSTTSLNILPENPIYNSSQQLFDKGIFRQKIDVTFFVKLDSSSTLKFAVDAFKSRSDNLDNFESSSIRPDQKRINRSERTLDFREDQQSFNFSSLWTKKLNKKGRLFSLKLRESILTSNTDGFLRSTNQFFNEADILDSTESIDQKKINKTVTYGLNSRATYSEPLSKVSSLTLSYGLGIYKSTLERNSYDQSNSGVYNLLDFDFSNNFKLRQFSNTGGLEFNYKKAKTAFGIGTSVTDVTFRQIDYYTSDVLNRHFVNWSPYANYSYSFSQQKSLKVTYYSFTKQPSIDQIQPIRVNNDPLNLFVGNPSLKPSFENVLSLLYTSYKMLNEQSVWVSGSYQVSLSPIATNIITDPNSGISTYQYVNVNNRRQEKYMLNISSDKKINSAGLTAGFDLDYQGGINYNLINGASNKIRINNLKAGLSLSRFNENLYNLKISAGPTYNTINSSLQENDSRGFGLNGDAQLVIYLPGKFEVNTDGNYQYNGPTKTFNQTLSRLLLNAALSKKFLTTENLRLSVQVRDLLNQNVGFSRYAGTNMISQERYTTIPRYFLISLTWDFNKLKKKSAK